MTWSADFVLFVAAVGILAFALGGVRLFRGRVARLHRFEECSDTFYHSARPLLSDDDTPAGVLILLRFLNQQLSNPAAARQAFLAVLFGRLSDANPNSSAVGDFKKFASSRKELAKAFNEACAAALVAMSYRSLVWGWLLRRLILFDVRRDTDRAERLAAELAEFSGSPPLAHC